MDGAQASCPPLDGLTYLLPLRSASRLDPSMSLASLRLHSLWRTCVPTGRLDWLRIPIGRLATGRVRPTGGQDARRPPSRTGVQGTARPTFTARMAVLLKSQMRGSVSNCQNGRQSNSHARIMKRTRTALKRKRCPIAVIKSTVARRTVIRTYWSPVSPDFVPCSAISAACLVKARNCSCLAL